MLPSTAAALVGAGVLSVLIYPPIAVLLGRRGQAGQPGPPGQARQAGEGGGELAARG